MNAWCVRLGWVLGVLLLGGALLPGCDAVDRAVDTTAYDDFTLTVEVVDRFVRLGDQTPIMVRLRRTDNSNLGKGLRGRIVITVSANGRVDQPRLDFVIADDTTRELFETVVFTGTVGGIAEVRASFLDATALVKIAVSGIETRINPGLNPDVNP